MSAPAAGFRGTQVFNTFANDSNFDSGVIPGSIIGAACLTKGFTAPSSGYFTAQVTKPGGGTAELGVFKKKSGSPTINEWDDVDLVAETSGSGSASLTFYANAGDQFVIAGDQVSGNVDELHIATAPSGTAATPSCYKTTQGGVDYLNITCGTPGATILYKPASSNVWSVYTGPVSLAGVNEKTWYNAIATKPDYNKSNQVNWQYLI